MRAPEDAYCGSFHVLERRHGFAEILERGVGVPVERLCLTGLKAEACGFKWMLSQGVDLAWDAWFGRLAQNHGISLIFLKRENLLRNFLSWYDKERHALSGGDGRVVTGRFRLPTEVLIEDMVPGGVERSLLSRGPFCRVGRRDAARVHHTGEDRGAVPTLG